MNKLKFRCIILFALAISCQVAANAQLPKLDPAGANKDRVVVIDENFEPQKSKPDGRPRHALGYEVWITTDGFLHCKTNLQLGSARIEFTSPVAAALTPTGMAGQAERGRPRSLNTTMWPGPGGYRFDIRGDGYKEKHAITLYLTSVWGGAVITLTNKKVPAQISKVLEFEEKQ
jgi:hypothetical protein